MLIWLCQLFSALQNCTRYQVELKCILEYTVTHLGFNLAFFWVDWKLGKQQVDVSNPPKRNQLPSNSLLRHLKFYYWWMENSTWNNITQPNNIILKLTLVQTHKAEIPVSYRNDWKEVRCSVEKLKMCVFLSGPGENRLAEESYPGPQGIHRYGKWPLCNHHWGFTHEKWQMKVLVKK